MAERMNREELDVLLGAYALDALDERERAEVDAYLAEESDAADEVAELKEMVGWLVEPSEQPPDLWSGIHAALDPPPASSKVARRRIGPASGAVGRVLAVAAAIAAVVAVSLAVIGSDEGSTNIAALASEARDEGAKTARLHSADGSQRVEVVYAEDGQGYVLAEELRRLPRGRTYQLWAMVGGEAAPRPISAGVLGRSFDATIFEFDGPVVGFAISVEDAPGATSPSATRLQGRLA
jgi:anti-sigma-K factor RskA